MKTRVITSIVGLLIIVPVLVFSHTYAGCLFAQLLSMVSVYEMTGAVGLRKKWHLCLPLYLPAAGLPLLIFFEQSRELFWEIGMLVLALSAFYILACSVFSRGKIKVTDASVLFTMLMYIFIGFNAIYFLRHQPRGGYLLALLFIVPWSTDTFAYFSGRLFGKHKLIPDVSPKKTVEGAIGGFVMATAITVLYGVLIGLFTDVHPQYLSLIVAGVLMSCASMIGDLVMSLVKRNYGVKDFSKLLPGHGGILDRFDSNLAAAFILIILYELPFGFVLFS